MKTNHRLTALALTISLALLVGCSSSSSSNARPDPSDPVPPPSDSDPVPPPSEPGPVPPPSDSGIQPTGERTTVAVIDTEFRLTHEDLAGQVSYFRSFANADGSDPEDTGFTEDGVLKENLITHGTPVASVIAGHAFGINSHVDLALLRAGSFEGTFNTASIHRAIQAVPSDARVLNLSLGANRQRMGGGASIFFTQSSENREVVMPSEDNPDGLAVVAGAGNHGWNRFVESGEPAGHYMTPGSTAWRDPETGELWDVIHRYLVVGAVNIHGVRASFSAYPGDHEDVRLRFLVAPGLGVPAANTGSDTDAGVFSGTSFAAPKVAGMLAGMFSEWPHLTAEQATARFLETADRSSPLYEDDTCGESGDVNCGLYYFGQGRADYAAAMAPDGDLMVPAGTTVDGPADRLDASYVQWASGFGGALDEEELQLAAFDDLGRDYTVDLGGHTLASRGHATRTGQRIEALAQNRAAVIEQTETLAPGLSLHSQMTADGQMGGSRVSLELGRYQIGMFGFADGFTDAINPWTRSGGGLGMIADAQSGWMDGLDSGYGFEVSLPMRERTTLTAQYWNASADISGLDSIGTYRQSRWDAQMGFAATDRLTLNVGSGYVTENDGLLGSRGFGALSLDGGLDLQTVHVGA